MRDPRPRVAAAAAVACLSILSACHTPTGGGTAVTRAEVEAVMAAQEAAWNRGDLETFVTYYDPGMTFLGGNGVTKGTDNLLNNYRRNYPTAEARGRLSFELLEFRPAGTDAILLLGQYRIARAEPASGFFTLMFKRTPEGLRIVHDHTSATLPTDGKK